MKPLLRLSCVGLIVLAGCTSPRDRSSPPPTAISGEVRTGQAVWRPRRQMPELAGELVVVNPPGPDFLIRFSKDPLCLVHAESRDGRWRVEFAAGTQHRQGRGRLPRWTAWLILADAMESRPLPKPWTGEVTASGEIQLSNPRTGESLEGFLVP
ncbi:MAG: hypothetical protein IT581_00615 [Verrucomicrobiales bacterium]|nr:hypothetical protein [Verrucomicrobiales bacterium]